MTENRFKFRVWNKSIKKYLINPLSTTRDGVFELTCGADEVIEQCTRFKDENGKLIYEGDILQDSLGNRFIISFIKIGYYLHEIKRNSWSLLTYNIDRYFTVIGNIHENEELLYVSK